MGFVSPGGLCGSGLPGTGRGRGDARGWQRRAALLFLVLTICAAGWAQEGAAHAVRDPRNADGTTLGAPMDLGTQWLAQPGDDPKWAQPDFDDSGWRTVNTEIPLGRQGLNHVDGIWYRIHVRLPEGAHDLAIAMRGFAGNEQIYANGVLVDSIGFPGNALRFVNVRYAEIPDAAVVGHSTLTIAIRGRLSRVQDVVPSMGGLGDYSTVLLGPASVMSEYATLYFFRNFTSNTANLIMTALLLLIALALALTSRSESEYAALSVMLTAGLLQQGVEIWRWIHSWPFATGYFLFSGVIGALYSVALMEFVRLVLGLR
ncbi:MAG: hypothetical protein WB974_21355, partial [Acidobacteriaceae bacterium]